MALATVYALGLRINEVLSLETGHIDSDRLLVWVRDGKGAKDRAVPLPRPLLGRLRRYWRDERPTSPTKFLFVARGATAPLDETTLQKTLSAARVDIALEKHATVHILLSVLFRAAFNSLQRLCANPRFVGGRIGALAVLHTWTRTLEWHPHVHMLVPGGGLDPDGRTWRPVPRRKSMFLVPVVPLANLFRARFLHLARRALPTVPVPHVPWGCTGSA
jgi:hypothetical protein